LPVDEVRRFNDVAHRRRLSVKPGLNVSLAESAGATTVFRFPGLGAVDLEYIDNWSLLARPENPRRTLPAVVAGTGAR